MVVDILQLRGNPFHVFAIIFLLFFIYSCGGGGGGGTSTSSVNALAWTPQGTYHGTGSHFGVGNTGMVAPLTSGAGPAYGNNTGYDSMKLILSESNCNVISQLLLIEFLIGLSSEISLIGLKISLYLFSKIFFDSNLSFMSSN